MAKFIKLTDRKTGAAFVLNVETIEYIQHGTAGVGSALVTTTNHTKYVVTEAMDDILQTLSDVGVAVLTVAKETLSTMEGVDTNGNETEL